MVIVRSPHRVARSPPLSAGLVRAGASESSAPVSSIARDPTTRINDDDDDAGRRSLGRVSGGSAASTSASVSISAAAERLMTKSSCTLCDTSCVAG
jgi:hypothetical protein